jgi:hypothetical protein
MTHFNPKNDGCFLSCNKLAVLDVTEFSGSNGWIDRFKNRNNIKFIPGCEVVSMLEI